MALVFIPSLMRNLTGGADRVEIPGATLRQVVNNLEAAHPGMKARLMDESGQFQEGLAVAINGETTHMGLLEPVEDTTEIHFIPAIGGGQAAPGGNLPSGW